MNNEKVPLIYCSCTRILLKQTSLKCTKKSLLSPIFTYNNGVFWHFSDQSRQNLNFFFGWGYFSVNSSDLLYFFTWAIITVKNLCLDAYKEKKPFLLRKVNTWSMAWFKEFVNIQTKLAYFLFLSGNFGIFSKVVCKMVLFSVCGKSKNLP